MQIARILSVFALLGAAAPTAGAQATVPDSTVSFLKLLEGRWFAANTPDGPARRPPADYVVHSYEWTVGGKAVRIREGFRGENANNSQLDGLVFWNPAREVVEFVAIAGHGPGQGRTFAGEYRLLADGTIERTYAVTYRSAADTPGEELGGEVRRFRETYRAITADSVESRLDWWRNGRWEPFGPGRYTVVRRRAPR